ncbi:MAG: hypothetical protein RLZZ594_935 [Actinomycetota bacterium]
MFVSALGAITGSGNRLGLRRVTSACVILVDGLGAHNLLSNSGHAPFISQASMSKIGTVFPSTTAAAISSFATGQMPGVHGVVGYQVFDRKAQAPLNLLTGLNDQTVGDWQRFETVSAVARAQGVNVYSVGPGEYSKSGFTSATMPGAEFVAGKTVSDRFSAAAKLLSTGKNKLVYVYVPELDQRAHAYGTASSQWRDMLEEHVDKAHHVYLDEYNDAIPGLVSVGGDPRVLYLYFEPGETPETRKELLEDALKERAAVFTSSEVCAAGYFGNVSLESRDTLPDLMVFARTRSALYHRGFAKPKSLQMIGQHGGISPEELMVPLVRFGAFV